MSKGHLMGCWSWPNFSAVNLETSFSSLLILTSGSNYMFKNHLNQNSKLIVKVLKNKFIFQHVCHPPQCASPLDLKHECCKCSPTLPNKSIWELLIKIQTQNFLI